MADAPKRGRGRPRKHSNPEAVRLAKQKYDQERKQKLRRKPTVEDDDEPSIPSVPVYQGPIVPVKDPTPPNFKDENLPSLLFNVDDDDDDDDDDNGGHTVEGRTAEQIGD